MPSRRQGGQKRETRSCFTSPSLCQRNGGLSHLSSAARLRNASSDISVCLMRQRSRIQLRLGHPIWA